MGDAMSDDRCTYTFTPDVEVMGVIYPAVQCTRFADAEHRHEWKWKDEERWRAMSR
jgi:hypothetical protein